MNTAQSFVLAVVQGLTEFLPISSSGHLTILQKLFDTTPSLALDVFLNTATLLSVLVFFRHRWKFFYENFNYILIGSIPAGLIGILFKKQFETLFANTGILPFCFLITSAYLISSKYLKTKNKQLNYLNSFVIGLFQAIAIFPAISRSGSTIFAGLLVGLSPTTAFNFSFSLFIPASIGALILSLKDFVVHRLIFTPSLLITFPVAFVIGITALSILQRVVISKKFWMFGIYTFLLAATLYFFPLK